MVDVNRGESDNALDDRYLFLEALLSTYFRGVVPVLFIIAMLAFIIGLLMFLREIYLATASLRIGPPEEEP